MSKLILSLALFAALLLPSPVPAAAAEKAPLAVTVSIPPLKYFLEAVGGGAVAVTVMAGKGQDPHSYEPTAAQMTGVAGAELYFTIGVPFETQWLPRFQSLNPAMRVVSLFDAVEKLQGKPDLALRDTLPGKGHRHRAHGHGAHDNDHGHDEHGHGLETDDPHVWLSPEAMLRTIPVMVAALAEKRPEQAEAFKERGEALRAAVAECDAAIRGILEPVKGGTFLTLHQSWTYYARNFGLREVSVELEGREPGPKSMAMLMDFAAANNVRLIVADSMAARSTVRAIAQNMKGRIVTAEPLAEDWPAALKEFSRNLAEALREAQ